MSKKSKNVSENKVVVRHQLQYILSANTGKTFEELKLKTKTQFKMLSLGENKSNKILEKNKAIEIKRNMKHVENKLEIALQLKNVVQEKMVRADRGSKIWKNGRVSWNLLPDDILLDKLKYELKSATERNED